MNQAVHQEGHDMELTVDVYRKNGSVCIVAPIVGATMQDIAINMAGNVLTISGIRHHRQPGVQDSDFLVKECYWGKFSRSIILPKHLKMDEINASFDAGILSIQIPEKPSSEVKVVPVSQNPYGHQNTTQ